MGTVEALELENLIVRKNKAMKFLDELMSRDDEQAEQEASAAIRWYDSEISRIRSKIENKI